MTALLTWGGVISTPWYHVESRQLAGATVTDLTFPHTAGRTPVILGAQLTDEDSEAVVFGERGDALNRLVSATEAGMATQVNAIRAKLLAGDPLGTLQWTSANGVVRTHTNMILLAKDFRLADAPQFAIGTDATKAWSWAFSARFVKYF